MFIKSFLPALALSLTLAPMPKNFKIITSPLLALGGFIMSYTLVEQNRFKGTYLEELEKDIESKRQLTEKELAKVQDQLNTEIEEFNKQKEEFIENFNKISADQLQWMETESARLESEYNNKWQTDLKALNEAHNQELNDLIEGYSEQIELLNQQLVQYRNQLIAIQKLPKLCNVNFGKSAEVINDLLLTLQRITDERVDSNKPWESYTCDYVRHNLSENEKTLTVWIAPKEPASVTKICRLAEELQVGIGFERISLTPDKGAIKVEMTNEEYIMPEYSESLEELQNQIVEPNEIIVKKIFNNFIHAFVFGETGSGKSTLVNNLIDLADYQTQLDGNNKKQLVKFYDPKFPHNNMDGDNRLVIDGVMPTWVTWQALYNVTAEIIGETEKRINNHKIEGAERMRDGDTETPLTKYDPLLYLLDEVENALRDNDDTFEDSRSHLSYESIKLFEENESLWTSKPSNAINRIMKLSRSSFVRFLGVGQSPMPKDYNLHKIDFLNCTRFWLGETAKTVLAGRGNEFVQLAPKDRVFLVNQIRIREKINLIRMSQGLEPIRYILAHAPNIPVVLFTAPSPHSVVELLYGVKYRYQGDFNLPVDLPQPTKVSNPVASQKPPNVDHKPKAIDMPSNPTREALLASLENSLAKSDTILSDLDHIIVEVLKATPNKAYTSAQLLNRKKVLNNYPKEQFLESVNKLVKLGYIRIVEGSKPVKIIYNDIDR